MRLRNRLTSLFTEAFRETGAVEAVQRMETGAVEAVRRIEARLDETAERLREVEDRIARPISLDEAEALDRFRLEKRLLESWHVPSSAELVSRARAVLAPLKPMQATGHRKIRMGSEHDGGYVMIDDFERTRLALSFGVEKNADWDLELARRGVNVQQYDHSIEEAPAAHPLIRWEKRRIGAMASPATESIHSILETAGLTNVKAAVVLKIDIEHGEWEVFDAASADDLACFSQITGEFHGFDFLADRSRLNVVERVIAKLTSQFAVVHVHANNHCGISNYFGLTVPYVLEFTFANREVYKFEPSDEVFPGPLDAPCDPGKPDIWLGRFSY